jgi:ABC-type phosphate/phosphonate transport system substrate-binding protein
MIRRWEAAAADLKEIGTTAPTPALPWITAAHREPAPLAEAIAEAIGGLSAEDRDALGILGAIRIAPERYLAIPNPPPPPPDRV